MGQHKQTKLNISREMARVALTSIPYCEINDYALANPDKLKALKEQKRTGRANAVKLTKQKIAIP